MNVATSPDRWALIKNLFAEAAELPTFARAPWLAEACGNDETLRAEVERLLAADEQAEAFLETAPINTFAREQFAEGESVGAYRIVRELGRGGMGTVYLAERAAAGFEQLVALKVIKRGMDSDEVLRRFFAERQILAQLNHPNIARLLDGGQTADGRPFYVMEYIEGVALDDYAKTHSLAVAERLRLFQQVCAAVQYAHQQLVIHRDLKPSNILVTADGTAKLLDFGIAKVLSTDDTATVTHALMLTPAYASPEQLRGARLTTASDVYALGVILYELLTGHSPYDVEPTATQAFSKAVCETEPPRPSVRVMRTEGGKQINAELDYLVMMALRKEPSRRYGSVEQFSADIHRYRNGLPVSARPDTLRYRATKFVQRNRALTAAALAVALSLSGGLALTLRQARIAERERARAQHRFDDVRQLANKFVFQYHDEVAKLPNSIALREMMVNDAKDYLTRLAQDANNDAALQLELAQAWIKIGDVLGKPYAPNLGHTDEAIKSYQQARQLAETVSVQRPNDATARRTLGLAMLNLGAAETRAGKFKTALPMLQQTVALLENTAADLTLKTALAAAYLRMGDCLARGNLTTHDKVIETYQQALRLNETILRESSDKDGNKTGAQRAIAVVEQRMGTTLSSSHSGAESAAQALVHHQRATALFAEVAAAEPANNKAQRDLSDQYLMQAEVLAKVGNLNQAVGDSERALVYFEKAATADPQNAEAQRDLATTHYIICSVNQSGGRWAAAASAMRQSLAIYEKLAARDPRNAENYSDMLSGYGRLSENEQRLGHTAAAAAAQQRKIESKARLDALR
jgi:eukaryotic-like serine/threonine-protein kinase